MDISELSYLPYSDEQKAILIELWKSFNEKMVPQTSINLDTKYTLLYVIDAGLSGEPKQHLEAFLGKELVELDIIYLPIVTYSWMTTQDGVSYLNVLLNQTDGFSVCMNNYGRSWRLEER